MNAFKKLALVAAVAGGIVLAASADQAEASKKRINIRIGNVQKHGHFHKHGQTHKHNHSHKHGFGHHHGHFGFKHHVPVVKYLYCPIHCCYYYIAPCGTKHYIR